MDIFQVTDELKGAPDQALVQYMLQPDGRYPQYLVATELHERKRIRDQYQAQRQKPTTTVAQDVTQQGIMQAMQQPAQPAQQQMPVQQPTQGFSGGGLVAFSQGGTPFDALHSSLIQAESGGRHYDGSGQILRSPAGAEGLGQLMPATQAKPGYGVAPLRDSSPEENLRQSRDYLSAMLREFNNDPAKAVAAYNAGPGRVKQLVAEYGDNWLAYAPTETQKHVPRVLSALGATTGAARTTTPMAGGDSGADTARGLPSALLAMRGTKSKGKKPKFTAPTSDDSASDMVDALLAALLRSGGGEPPVQMADGGRPKDRDPNADIAERLRWMRDDAGSLYDNAVEYTSSRVIPMLSRALTGSEQGLAQRPAPDQSGAATLGASTRQLLGTPVNLWNMAGETGPYLRDLGGIASEFARGLAPELMPGPGKPQGIAAVAGKQGEPAGTGALGGGPPLRTLGAPAPTQEPPPADSTVSMDGWGLKPLEQLAGELFSTERNMTPEQHRATIEQYLVQDPERKKRDMWMALAQAGFATAAGESPHALQNVGQGALAGLGALQQSQAQGDRQKDIVNMLALRRSMGDEDYNNQLKWKQLEYQLSMESAKRGEGISLMDLATILDKFSSIDSRVVEAAGPGFDNLVSLGQSAMTAAMEAEAAGDAETASAERAKAQRLFVEAQRLLDTTRAVVTGPQSSMMPGIRGAFTQ